MTEKDELAKKINDIMQKGSYGEMIAELAELDLPMATNNVHAKGGMGGRAINLTYVDNYSSLMLVYTFLLSQMDKKRFNGDANYELNKSLLKVLKQAMDDQKKYQYDFLQAVNLLNEQKD
ncbi:hypothetical protein ACFSCX_02110 [Bacillus salitolerans]|uniref:Uncharacterized protein n=1 Tax=Bacillus salitolerans TaxID=1437434 RepID=A0ABW4LJN6_9BACI